MLGSNTVRFFASVRSLCCTAALLGAHATGASPLFSFEKLLPYWSTSYLVSYWGNAFVRLGSLTVSLLRCGLLNPSFPPAAQHHFPAVVADPPRTSWIRAWC